MSARFFRLLVLLVLTVLIARYCCFSPPADQAYSPLQQPAVTQSIPKLLIFCDRQVLKDPAKCADMLRTPILQQYLSDQVCNPVKVELYAMGCSTARGQNLLPNCYIDPKESSMISQGSFQTKGLVINRWQKDFDRLHEASEQDGCNQIIASLHVLDQRLRSASPGDNIRVVYVSNWNEMDNSNDFDRQSYRLFSNNPQEGGIYRLEESVLDEMIRQSDDTRSHMRQWAESLKNTLGKLGVPVLKVYFLTIKQDIQDDGGTHLTTRLTAFWDRLFGFAGLERVRIDNLRSCLH